MVSKKSLALFVGINTLMCSVSYLHYSLLSYFNNHILVAYATVLMKAGMLYYVLNRITQHRPRIFPANAPLPEFQWTPFLTTYGIETITYLLAHFLATEPSPLWKDVLLFIPVSFAYELVFDFFHYGTHRFLHSVPLLYRTIHKKHHETTMINANTTYNHTPLDLLITNLIPILCASAIVHVSPYTLTLLFWYKTIVEISGHTGKGTSGSFIQCIYLPEALGISLYSIDHSLHHLNLAVNFSKRFAIWDRLFGTKGSANPPKESTILDIE